MYTYGNKQFTKEQIISVAKNQKLFLLFLLLVIIFYVLLKFTSNQAGQ